MKNIWIIGVLFFPFLQACNDDEEEPDLTAPTIEMSRPEIFGSYDEIIPFNALFTDDEALATYSIDIHGNFDNHNHGRVAIDPNLHQFSFKENYSLPPIASFQVNDTISLADSILAGPYHFIVQSIDRAGNATDFQNGTNVEILIQLANSSMAVIDITNIIHDELVIEVNEPFLVKGTITDPTEGKLGGFQEVKIDLATPNENFDDGHGRISDITDFLYQVTYEKNDLEPYTNPNGSLNIESMVSYTLSSEEANLLQSEGIDHLIFSLFVEDMQGNITFSILAVHMI